MAKRVQDRGKGIICGVRMMVNLYSSRKYKLETTRVLFQRAILSWRTDL